MELSKQALAVLEKRYLLTKEDGTKELPEEMFLRVAKCVAGADGGKYEEDYYKLMTELKFLPNSPTLMNAGTELGMLSGCFVLPIRDSMESIFEAVKNTALIHKSGGGTGFSFSELRPENDIVGTTGGAASGPISFMRAFDVVTDVVKQGGRRRGANMAILRANHPDILKFIDCKVDDKSFKNFNISVGITNAEMRAVEEGGHIRLINPRTKAVVGLVDAAILFNQIVEAAWKCGDPGLLFLDTINKDNVAPDLGEIVGVNPCVTGDTLVAVADGRNTVPIKQLAEDGVDVPVYCADEDGVICVRIGSKPRLTGRNRDVYKVLLDDGSFIKVTDNHKFILRDGAIKTALELLLGDSLLPFYKYQYSYGDVEGYWGINLNNGTLTQEHRMFVEAKLGRKLLPYPEEVVHHLDYSLSNNFWDNLMVMSSGEHISLHQQGNNNVMRDKWWNQLSEDEKKTHRDNMSNATKGERNGMFGRRHSVVSKQLMSYKTSQKFLNLEFREKHRQAVLNSSYKFAPKLRGYRVDRETRTCVYCGEGFVVKESSSQIFCSQRCAIYDLNHKKRGSTVDVGIRQRISHTLKERIANDGRLLESKRAAAFESAKSKALFIGRFLVDHGFALSEADWSTYRNSVRRDLGVYHFISIEKIIELFGSFDSFCLLVKQSNHKVDRIEYVGQEDVYNITVDAFHTICYVTKDSQTKEGKRLLSGIVTRQCAEEPLLPFESCNLGSIDLSKFVFEGDHINWEDLRHAIVLAVRFLDNVITVNKLPLPEIREMTNLLRPIGLGIMGWADILIKLGIRYDSDDALALAHRVGIFFKEVALAASHQLAKEKGPFPYFPKSIYKDSQPLRNSRLLCIAPTGTLSLIANCSGGIEPVFSFRYERVFDGKKLEFIHPELERWWKSHPGIEWPEYFVSAHDISPEWHLKMLSAFQQHVDAGVSKTINLPHSATVEDVKKVYMQAWKMGCKGITVFRDGCKSEQVLVSSDKVQQDVEFGYFKPRERPARLEGNTIKIKIGCGNFYVTVNHDGDGPYEVFSSLGKGGGCASAQLEAISRLISLALRSGIDAESIIKHLRGIRCSSPTWSDGKQVLSCADAIGLVLQMNMGEGKELVVDDLVDQGFQCPECSMSLVFKEGCWTCLNCGYSKCG